MTHQQKAATVLHSLIALNTCAIGLSEYLRTFEVHGTVKHRLKIFESHLKCLHRDITTNLSESDRAIFNKEFSDRDIEVYGSIFSMLANMTDTDRDFVENFITNYAKQGDAVHEAQQVQEAI